MSNDFSNLPAPHFLEPKSIDVIFAELKSILLDYMPSMADTLNLESEPITKLLKAYSYREFIHTNEINERARSSLLYFAKGQDLDVVIKNQFQLTRNIIQEATEDTPAIYESDADFVARAEQNNSAVSVAGPTEYFEILAKNAHGDVAAVKAVSPSPAVVNVHVLSHSNNGEASPDVLNAVDAYLTNPARQPLGIDVNTLQSELISASIEAELILDSSGGVGAQQIISNAKAAIEDYQRKRQIGRPLPLSKLYALLHVAGVAEVILISPTTDIDVTTTQSVIIDSIEVREHGE